MLKVLAKTRKRTVIITHNSSIAQAADKVIGYDAKVKREKVTKSKSKNIDG